MQKRECSGKAFAALGLQRLYVQKSSFSEGQSSGYRDASVASLELICSGSGFSEGGNRY